MLVKNIHKKIQETLEARRRALSRKEIKFGEEKVPQWNPELAIVSHFKTPDEAMDKLSAVGFNSIPAGVIV